MMQQDPTEVPEGSVFDKALENMVATSETAFRTFRAQEAAAAAAAPPKAAPRRHPPMPYRVPAPGDEVRLSGLRSRPQLDGALGEVVGATDEEGFVTVRLDTEGAPRTMKVRPQRLRPLRS